MQNQSNFLIHLSILFRNTQKYFDKVLAQCDIGSGQLIFLFSIYEHEGITMQEVTQIGELDKGTTTKSIQKLIEQGYIQSRIDENDHRVKRLYTTSKAANIMNSLYEYRNECRKKLAEDVDFETFEKMLGVACENSKNYLVPKDTYQDMKIGGLQKLTLLDYPGKLASTVFTSGCSFKCPFCHNKELVFVPENYSFLDTEKVLSYLAKRKNLLDGICITGGEPLLQEGLLPFIEAVKEMGYFVKLDTNGNNPEKLKEIVNSGLVDYVAMDIKNCKSKYHETVGLNEHVFDIHRIEESVSFLLSGEVDYEFRTTVVKELHTKEDLLSLAKWIKSAKNYYLQQYVDSENVIDRKWSAYNKEEMEDLCNAVKEIIPVCKLRGVKEN